MEIHYSDTESINRHSSTEAWSDWGGTRVVTTDDIRAFASLTDNHQWIHDNPERCKSESPYGALIAHGLLLVTLIPALLPDEGTTLIGHKVRIVRGLDNLRLPSPVYAGEEVRVRVRRLKAYAAQSGKGTIVEREVELWSEGGERPAVTCVLKLQYF